MTTRTVGPNQVFKTITAAMAVSAPGDTIVLEAGYSNETATVTKLNMTINGGSSSTGIVLDLAVGIPTFTLTGTAPFIVYDAPDANGIVGNGGDNIVIVTAGADTVDGGLGNDLLIVDYRLATGAVTGDSTSNFTDAGGSGMATITSGTFEHFNVFTAGGADTLTTGAGDDIIVAGNGANTVTVGQGRNSVTGGNDADTFTGLDGGNFFDGGNGTNNMTTGGGVDTVLSGTGADTIVTGGGNDTITARGGADNITAGAGTDRLIVDYSAMTTAVIGGVISGNLGAGYTGNIADSAGSTLGFNTVEYFAITTGSGNDNILTGDGNDVLVGGAGIDALSSGGGNDVLMGGTGTDSLDGGLGSDFYILEDGNDSVVDGGGIDVATSTISRALSNYMSVDNLVLLGSAMIGGGNDLDNVVTGNALANTLSGGLGNDTLIGAGGNDILNGGAGFDRLVGGLGNDQLAGGAAGDVFVFDTAPNASTNRDVVADFSHVDDSFHLDNAVFSKLTATGTLNANYFHAGAAAADGNDYIVYNSANGALYYDADGNGAGSAIMFAVLANREALTNSDFGVI